MELYAVEGRCEGYEPVWTCQGILRFPQRMLIDNMWFAEECFLEAVLADEDERGRWAVPDHDKWLSVPGFPDFLNDPSKLSAAVVRPMTVEERKAYYADVDAPEYPDETPRLVFLAGSPCIRLGGKVIRLSRRQYTLLSMTVEQGEVPREAALKAVQAVPSDSPTPQKQVEFDGLYDLRKGILQKVEKACGKPFRKLLTEAFKVEGRAFHYDVEELPTATE